jgi:alpha-L-fucosidase
MAVADSPSSIANTAQPDHLEGGRSWFHRHRFGLFVHWGLYALTGFHEQHQQRLGVPRREYEALATQFNLRHFRPDEWLDVMAAAGMEYLILTTKHHDGFCLWDTRQTTFNVTNTPYRRDVVAELAEACGRRGVKLGFYYSVVDWNHPDYPNRGRHHELSGPEPGDTQDEGRYIEFVRAQVRELCDGRYGEVSAFWWDMNVPEWVDPSINAIIRDAQPSCVINDRGFDGGDFSTPEREWDRDASGRAAFRRPVEACNSVGALSWGFKRDEEFYTRRHLQRAMCNYMSRGGNYLLNAGPDADGRFDPHATRMLADIGRWYAKASPALIDVEPLPDLPDNPAVRLTRRGERLYVILAAAPATTGVRLKPIDIAPRRAVVLNTGNPATFVLDRTPADAGADRPYLRLLDLPVESHANEVLIVELEFDRPATWEQAAATGEVRL